MQFSVRFYYDADGNKPVLAFLEDLRKQDRILHKLVVAGIKKLETSERHGPPLTQLVDHKYTIFELRIGDKNIARCAGYLGYPFQKRALMMALPVLFLGNLRIR